MSYLFYTNMQKRQDGQVYADLHKTDERIYFAAEDAQKSIDSIALIAPYRHVVPMVAMTTQDREDEQQEREALLALLQQAAVHCPDDLRQKIAQTIAAAPKSWTPASILPEMTTTEYGWPRSKPVLAYRRKSKCQSVVVCQQIDEDSPPRWVTDCADAWDVTDDVVRWRELPPILLTEPAPPIDEAAK